MPLPPLVDYVIPRCQNGDKFEIFALGKRIFVHHDFVDNQNIGVFCARQNVLFARRVVIRHVAELIEEIEIEFLSFCGCPVKNDNFHN